MNAPGPASHSKSNRSLRWARALGLALCLAFPVLGAGAQAAHTAERRGSIPTRDALELTLTADRGSVRVFTDSPSELLYRVTLQAPAGTTESGLEQFTFTARETQSGGVLEGRFPPGAGLLNIWVNYELHVPHRYNLRITTGAGDIRVSEIEGRVVLTTGGGNIEAAQIGRDLPGAGHKDEIVARLESGGGNISVGSVFGALRAVTAGGHITAGDILGDAVLQTAGGNIRVESVARSARFSTAGGNIYAGHTGGSLVAETAGGRIDLGEVAGSVRSRTARGGRALRLEAEPYDKQPVPKLEQGAAPRPRGPRLARNLRLRESGPGLEFPFSEGLDPQSFAGVWDLPIEGGLAQWSRQMESLWWGGVLADPADQQERLIQAPAPRYPEAARRARIEGEVTLGLRIGRDGSVEEVKLLSGDPVLGRAAIEAIEQWRYAPLRLGGRPVSVLTSVTLAFDLR
jgi:TonB family protein